MLLCSQVFDVSTLFHHTAYFLESCSDGQRRDLTQGSGYLALHPQPGEALKEPPHVFYTSLCEWVIEVEEGQKINITWDVYPLFHSFAIDDEDESSDPDNEDGDEDAEADEEDEDEDGAKTRGVNFGDVGGGSERREFYGNTKAEEKFEKASYDSENREYLNKRNDKTNNCFFTLKFIENGLVAAVDTICIDQAPKHKLAYFSKTNKLGILLRPIQSKDDVTTRTNILPHYLPPSFPLSHALPFSSSSSSSSILSHSFNTSPKVLSPFLHSASFHKSRSGNYLSKSVGGTYGREAMNLSTFFLFNLQRFFKRPFILRYQGIFNPTFLSTTMLLFLLI